MKMIGIAAAGLIALQAQPASAEPAAPAPSEALVDRFIAVIPDRESIAAVPTEVDPAELERLIALNPGKEAKLRPILQADLACTGPAVTAVTFRMLRKVARDLGPDRLQKLINFYEGPDYAAFESLGKRMEGNPAPSAEDKAALAKLMAAYPLQAFVDRMGRVGDMIAADQAFVSEARKCAADQAAALQAAGLRTH